MRRGNGLESTHDEPIRERYDIAVTEDAVVRTIRIGDRIVSEHRLATDAGAAADPAASYDHTFLRLDEMPGTFHAYGDVRVADLFSGCGGLSLGIREACRALGLSFQSVFAVDHHGPSLDVYKANFTPTHAHHGDIESVLNGELGTKVTSGERAWLEKLLPISILLAGPPCQGHSDLNNHSRRKDRRNLLYDRVVRMAEIALPASILIENVPTVIHSTGDVVKRAQIVLERLGYSVDSVVVDLSAIGVPQVRKRHVLLASLLGPVSIQRFLKPHYCDARDLSWAIGDLSDRMGLGLLDRASEHNAENQRRMRYLFENGLYELPDPERPCCHRNGHSYPSMYGRLHWDKPAQTITSGFTSPGQGRFVHPERPRTLTPHEAARLQFFPDFFDFTEAGKRTPLALMIGNAVPMKLSYLLGLQLLASRVCQFESGDS